MVSRFGQTLRRISLGDYYDELAINMDGKTSSSFTSSSSSSNPLSAEDSLRIKFLVSEISRRLRDRIARKVPDFDSDDYSVVLLNALSSLRGRELPGFMSARLLMGSLSLDLDHWRVEVEDAFHQALLVYMATSEQLSKKLASKFPKVRKLLMGIMEGRKKGRKKDEFITLPFVFMTLPLVIHCLTIIVDDNHHSTTYIYHNTIHTYTL